MGRDSEAWRATVRMREENMETTGKEVRKLMEYLREKDLSHKLWTVGGVREDS